MKGEKIGFWKTLKTTKGAWKLLAVCLAVIIVFSCIGALMAHSGTKVVIRNISFDKRGAVLTAELYTPRHVSAEDNLPAVLLAHGGGVSNGVMGGFAQELARRGFVVLNVNAYGAGTSENPPTDETGAAPGALWSPRGLHDAYGQDQDCRRRSLHGQYPHRLRRRHGRLLDDAERHAGKRSVRGLWHRAYRGTDL